MEYLADNFSYFLKSFLTSFKFHLCHFLSVNVVAAAAGSALAFFIVATITAVCCCIVCCVRRARVRRRAHIHVTAVSTVPYVSLATVPPTQIAPVTTPESYTVILMLSVVSVILVLSGCLSVCCSRTRCPISNTSSFSATMA